jgi:hypothetical protein
MHGALRLAACRPSTSTTTCLTGEVPPLRRATLPGVIQPSNKSAYHPLSHSEIAGGNAWEHFLLNCVGALNDLFEVQRLLDLPTASRNGEFSSCLP